MAENTIAKEKQEEMVKTELNEGLNNNAQELLNLADQWSRSNRHIAIGEGYQRLSKAAIWEVRWQSAQSNESC